MAYEDQPLDFNQRIAVLYYVERYGLNALKEKLNDNALFEEMKDFVTHIFDFGWKTKDYIISCTDENVVWEDFLVEL